MESRSPSSRSLRIGLYGPFGWGNLGDAAIQEAMIHNIRIRHPDARIEAFSLNPDDTNEIHGIACHPILRGWRSRRAAESESSPGPSPKLEGASRPKSLRERFEAELNGIAVLRAVVRSAKSLLRPLAELFREARFVWRARRTLEGFDLFLVSGGGQLADFWGGPFYHPYTLLKWVACARSAGSRVHIVSVGAGPIRHGLSRLFLGLVLRLAHSRSYRDQASRELLARHFGFPRSDPVVPDLAFSLPSPGAPPVEDPVAGALAIGIAPMAYLHPSPGVWPEHDPIRYRSHVERQASLVRGLLAEGHHVRLFSTQIRSDRHALDDVVEELRDENGRLPHGLTADPTLRLYHALEQIASCQVVVASRLHGVILSYLLHRPVLAVRYQQKVDAIVEQFGEGRHTMDIDTSTGEELLAGVLALVRDRSGVHRRIRTQTLQHREALRSQYDRLLAPPREPA